MKYIVLAATILVSGCSYTPVVDLRASKDEAQLYQRDLTECRSLAKEIDYSFTSAYAKGVNKCLQGRGHSVLNDYSSAGGFLIFK